MSISGAGVLSSSKHPAEAQAFVRWIAGEGGREVLRDGRSSEFAVGTGAASNAKLEPLSSPASPRVEPAGINGKAVTDLMTDAGLM